jgi:molecular chaperone GrpE
MMRKKRQSEDPDMPTHDDPAPPEAQESGAPDADANEQGSRDEAEYDPTEHIEQLERERDEAVDRYKRALADYSNFQKRAIQNEHVAREQATAGVIRNLFPVLDHFTLALDQDPESITAAQFLDGMKLVRDELLRALQMHGLRLIETKPGDAFDPMIHEAVAHVACEGVAPGAVTHVTQAGYMLGDRVLRATKVTVAPSEGAGTGSAPDEVSGEDATTED